QCAAPLAGLALLSTPYGAQWARSAPAIANPPLEVSLSGYLPEADGATFTGRLHDAYLPAVPVSCGRDLTGTCTLATGPLVTGVLHRVAATTTAELSIVLLPGSALKVGRNRIWHLREELASALPAPLRAVLTRARTGDRRNTGYRRLDGRRRQHDGGHRDAPAHDRRQGAAGHRHHPAGRHRREVRGGPEGAGPRGGDRQGEPGHPDARRGQADHHAVL